jgi:hypothetical protein
MTIAAESTIDLQRAHEAITTKLHSLGVSGALADDLAVESLQCTDLADLLSNDWPWDRKPRGSLGTFGNLGPDWTIKGFELIDLTQLLPAAVTLVVAGPTLPVAAGALTSVLCMLYRLRKKGFTPNPAQGRVLVALRQQPLTLAQVTEKVNLATNSEWTTKEMKEVLESLTQVKLNNGTVAAVVTFDGAKWSTDATGLWSVPYMPELTWSLLTRRRA